MTDPTVDALAAAMPCGHIYAIHGGRCNEQGDHIAHGYSHDYMPVERRTGSERRALADAGYVVVRAEDGVRDALERVVRLMGAIPYSVDVEQAGAQAEVAILEARAALATKEAP